MNIIFHLNNLPPMRITVPDDEEVKTWHDDYSYILKSCDKVEIVLNGKVIGGTIAIAKCGDIHLCQLPKSGYRSYMGSIQPGFRVVLRDGCHMANKSFFI